MPSKYYLENIRGRFGIHPELKRNLRLTRPMLYRFQCTTVELYIPILLSHRDSNPNLQNQNLSCYHYTMRQFNCGPGRIRTYSAETLDLQSSPSLQLRRVPIKNCFKNPLTKLLGFSSSEESQIKLSNVQYIKIAIVPLLTISRLVVCPTSIYIRIN